MSDAYDMIDRFLRNNLGSDDDYAEYSKALDSLCCAQPAQAGQVLTDDFIKAEALEAFDCYWDADDETLVNKYGHGVYLSRFIDFARAIERAVLSKRGPMTDEQVTAAFVREPIAMSRHDFTQGIRYAEVYHGIGGEKGGTT